MKRSICRCQVHASIVALLLAMVLMCFSIAQAEEVSVEITSFMRRDVTENGQIRCSELMEAVLTGYDGNPYALTYEWTNVSCNADLYIYNSHNMDGIDDSPGEIEKIGKKESASGRGFAWASVRSKDARNYDGEIKVTVKDSSGKVLATDTYKDFLDPDLKQDLDGIAFGMFIGETVNVKDLLGRSAIVHITCGASGISEGRIASGQSVAELKKQGNDYYVTGKEMGETSASITIKKGYCSFHTNQTEKVTTPIYVFKKPKTSTTTTTLTLTDLDNRCDYFIGSVQGEHVGNTVVFTGLTPNTEYEVTVRGTYEDDGTVKYAYAYVKDTTKPVWAATVNVYLDNVLTDAADVLNAADLYLYDESKPDNGYLPMTKSTTGIYTAGVLNGNYHVYSYDGEKYLQVHNAALQINNANRTIDLRYYSVQYDCDGGSFAQGDDPGKLIYPAGSTVTTVTQEPHLDGHAFLGWKLDENLYDPAERITSSIGSAIVLLAQWEKSVTVTINVTIDHQGGDGYDTAEDKDKVSVYLLEKRTSDPAMLETSDELHFTHEQVRDENGNSKNYAYSASYIENQPQDLEHTAISTYSATVPTYTNKSGSSEFDVRVHKSRYDVESVNCEKDENGNWQIDVLLKFHPSNFDLEYSVRMDPDVPVELYPDAVVYKVACWAGEERGWEIITQMEGGKGGDLVTIDPATGKGSGSYPVWQYDAGHHTPYGYRVVLTGFVYDEHTIVVPTQTGVAAEYSDGNYTAVMSGVEDGREYGQGFNGAYFDGETQQGTLDAVITMEAYDVTFDAMGGTVNGEPVQTVQDQFYIPDFSDYEPVNGQHHFLGWFMDEACTVPATENELLTTDVTLYARWDRILTGKVTVEGAYEQNGVTIQVGEHDRPGYVDVLLQELVGDNPQTIDSATLNVTWSEDIGTTTDYVFTGLSPDKTYRVAFEEVNYIAAYRNATTASDGYNDTDYTAVYSNKVNETFVDGWMHFEPESYDQPVTVDATRIGTAFRPGNVLVEVHYRKTGSGAPLKVISQHTVDPFGIWVQMNADTGKPDQTYVQSVWQEVWDGELYDYQVQVTKIDNQLPADLPLHIRYGNVSRWSPVHGQPTATLEAILVPNTYAITYHLGDGFEDVQDENGHTWSFDTPISYIPSSEGYTFSGWYANEECTGAPVTQIDAQCGADTDLYARWTPRSDLTLTVHHRDKDDQSEIHASETKSDMTMGANVNIAELVVDIPGYQYVSSDPEALTIGPENNVLILYYEKTSIDYTVKYFYDEEEDTSRAVTAQAVYKSEVTAYAEKPKQGFAFDRVENLPLVIGASSEENIINVYYATDVLRDGDKTDNPDDDDSETGGDQIPDKYQAVVNFTIENGVWSDGSSDKITEVFTLKTYNPEAGVWTETNVVLGNTIPVNMQPAVGYEASSGTWTPQPDQNAILTGNADYHYHYGQKSRISVQIEVVNGTSNPAPSTLVFDYDASETTQIEFAPDDGYILESVTVNGAAGQLTDGKYYLHVHTEDLYIKVVYTEDVFGGGDEGDEPDEIPDKYQKKVVFKVVNGKWADGTSADITEIATLKKNGEWSVEGEDTLNVPVGMKADEDFKNGAWNADYLNGEGVSSLIVKADDPDEQVFTHSFQRSIIDFEAKALYQVIHWLQQTDGTYTKADVDFPLQGYVGTEVTATARFYDHYALKGSLPKGIVRDPRPQTEGGEPDLLTLNVYYDLDQHMVQYDLNGGNGATGVSYSVQTYMCGMTEQLKAAPSYPGHLFMGWQDQYGNLYQAGDELVIRRDYVFTAVWSVYSLPQTGDTENVILLVGLMAGSALLLMILFKRNHLRKAS